MADYKITKSRVYCFISDKNEERANKLRQEMGSEKVKYITKKIKTWNKGRAKIETHDA